MSDSDGAAGSTASSSRKRANSSGGDRSSPSPPRNGAASSYAHGVVSSATPAAPALAPAPAPTTSSKKKQKKGSRGSNTGVQAFVPPGVVISRLAEDCAPQLSLTKDQLTITGNKGFRMARATKGVSNGTWYWECTVLPPETKEGHCRLGWSLSTGSLQGPVGYDKSSYAYRDIAGSKVHESLRTDNYGEPWGEGDIIGFLIKLKSPSEEEMIDMVGAASDSGRLSVAAAAAALAAGNSPSERAATATAAAAAGGANAFNEIRFFKNGRDQGVAFSGIMPGTYFPAVSLYMGGSVRVNFGPEFVYPPPRSHGWKPVASLKPFSKDEMKTQRKEIKRERAARGLETATRQIGCAPPLPSLNGIGSPAGSTNGNASSRSSSPLPPAGAATESTATSKPGKSGGGGGGREGPVEQQGGSEGRSSPTREGQGEEEKKKTKETDNNREKATENKKEKGHQAEATAATAEAAAEEENTSKSPASDPEAAAAAAAAAGPSSSLADADEAGALDKAGSGGGTNPACPARKGQDSRHGQRGAEAAEGGDAEAKKGDQADVKEEEGSKPSEAGVAAAEAAAVPRGGGGGGGGKGAGSGPSLMEVEGNSGAGEGAKKAPEKEKEEGAPASTRTSTSGGGSSSSSSEIVEPAKEAEDRSKRGGRAADDEKGRGGKDAPAPASSEKVAVSPMEVDKGNDDGGGGGQREKTGKAR